MPLLDLSRQEPVGIKAFRVRPEIGVAVQGVGDHRDRGFGWQHTFGEFVLVLGPASVEHHGWIQAHGFLDNALEQRKLGEILRRRWCTL